MLVDTDVKLFYDVLQSLGFDYFLEQGMNLVSTEGSSSGESPKKESRSSKLLKQMSQGSHSAHFVLHTLEKLKAYIEIDLCEESKSVLTLAPMSLRLLSKVNETNRPSS